MGWDGYLELAGNEIINVARTEKYAENMTALRKIYKNDALPALLDHDPYTTPDLDDAPWFESRLPASREFFGLYPLEVTGLDDSTIGATAIEGVADGGVVTRVRRAVKVTVFNVLLLGGSDAGVEVGRQWLTRTLLGACGAEEGWGGAELRYFASEPYTGLWDGSHACYNYHGTNSTDPLVVAEQLGRTIRHTQVSVGPAETSRKVTSDGFVVSTVTFTLSSGDPYVYGPQIPFLERWGDPEDSNPWPFDDPPPGASVGSTFTYTDPVCAVPSYIPVFDPLSPAITAPPAPPGIVWGSFNPPSVWTRRQAVLPASLVPGWGSALPVVNFTAHAAEVRNARLRIYPDAPALGTLVEGEECNFVADIVVSFIPQGSTLTVDVPEKAIYVTDASGDTRRADALVFSTEGTPFKWPELTCGVQHLICLDRDPLSAAPIVDVALVERFG